MTIGFSSSSAYQFTVRTTDNTKALTEKIDIYPHFINDFRLDPTRKFYQRIHEIYSFSPVAGFGPITFAPFETVNVNEPIFADVENTAFNEVRQMEVTHYVKPTERIKDLK